MSRPTFISISFPGSSALYEFLSTHIYPFIRWCTLIICLLCGFPPSNAQAQTSMLPMQHEIWMKYEKEFTSTQHYDNPLYQVREFVVTFTSPSGKETRINGFWDGGLIWKVRFMPNEIGKWTLTTHCSDPSNSGLHEITGSFDCVAHDNPHAIYRRGSIQKPAGSYHLTYADGTPFFWTGCTAWNGALKSTSEEWDKYLKDRVEKNFSVIQFVTTQWRGAKSDRNGRVAFSGSGKIEIHPEFFLRLDEKIDRINEYGLIAAPVLLWALPVGSGRDLSPGYYLPQDEAILLAKYMVARYGGNQVIWILGGDGRYINEYEQRWKNIGRGVFGKSHPGIVAQHPHGLSWIGNEYSEEDWLDIAGYQSSHSTSEKTVSWINTGPPAREWNRLAPKALMNMEPIYEEIRENASATEVRQAMYWSLFATPISGITYGANGIWPWLRKGERILNHGDAPWTSTWEESLDLPGGRQTGYLAEFIQQFDWWNFRPAHEELLVHQPGNEQYNHFISMVRSPDYGTILGYVPQQSTFKIYNPDPKRYQLQWFDPETNEYSATEIIDAPQSYVIELASPGVGDGVFILIEQ